MVEKANLAGRLPQVAKKMHGHLQQWRESVGAVMPKPNPNYDAEKADQGLTGYEKPTRPA